MEYNIMQYSLKPRNPQMQDLYVCYNNFEGMYSLFVIIMNNLLLIWGTAGK